MKSLGITIDNINTMEEQSRFEPLLKGEDLQKTTDSLVTSTRDYGDSLSLGLSNRPFRTLQVKLSEARTDLTTMEP
ncbi:hypothetical protein FKM82_027260 [Ascaphus truei]